MLIDHETHVTFDRSQTKKEIKSLQRKLAAIQRLYGKKGVPIVILIAGQSASGKGQAVSSLLSELDPRSYKLHTVPSPPTDDIRYPFFRRYWNRLPSNGTIGLFIDNWYRALFHRFKNFKSTADQTDWGQRINIFERQLTNAGCRIFKFYLHVSEKEQKKRIKKLTSDKHTSWRIKPEDKQMLKEYNHTLENAERIIDCTHQENSRWTIVPADNGQYVLLCMLRTLVDELEHKTENHIVPPPDIRLLVGDNESESIPSLAKADLSISLSRDEYEKSLAKLQSQLQKLHYKIYRKKIPLVIAFEGWDAAGKGGNIKRLAHSLDPRGYEVLPIGPPSVDERSHHFLWRFWKRVPRTGHIAIFDRTWYGRVLVEKIEGFCTPEECERSYNEIVEMEYEWARSGMVILKFWVHIDKEEQLRRFKERENISYKKWKITDEDWRNREKWDQYAEAVDTMFARTHTDWGPWTIVESNDKLYARIKVLKTVVNSLKSCFNDKA